MKDLNFKLVFLQCYLKESIEEVSSIGETGDDLCDMEMATYKSAYEEILDVVNDLIAGRIVNEVPSIDSVPVVRCGDCKYFYSDDCHFHEWYRAEPHFNDYCSRGERKENV